jgi:RNA polymerase sigma factor (sigma-70 family)
VSEFPDTEWSAILAAQAGEESALDELVAKYRPAVVRYVRARGLGSEAEDLAQEVFVRLIFRGALARVQRGRGRFRSLVMAVSQHAIGNHFEYMQAAKRGGGKVLSLSEVELAVAPPDETFDRAWVRTLLRVSLARLEQRHPRYHTAIDMFVFGGRPQDEVAAAMSASRQEVKNWIFRGRAKLAEFLKQEIRAYCATPEEFAEELAALQPYMP